MIRDLDEALAQAIAHSDERQAILDAARELEASSLETSLDRVQTEIEIEDELQSLRARLAEDVRRDG